MTLNQWSVQAALKEVQIHFHRKSEVWIWGSRVFIILCLPWRCWPWRCSLVRRFPPSLKRCTTDYIVAVWCNSYIMLNSFLWSVSRSFTHSLFFFLFFFFTDAYHQYKEISRSDLLLLIHIPASGLHPIMPLWVQEVKEMLVSNINLNFIQRTKHYDRLLMAWVQDLPMLLWLRCICGKGCCSYYIILFCFFAVQCKAFSVNMIIMY